MILSIILFIHSIGFTFNESEHTKKFIQTITLQVLVSLFVINKDFIIEKAFNKLTKDNCSIVLCCVFTGNNKCKAGNVKVHLWTFIKFDE